MKKIMLLVLCGGGIALSVLVTMLVIANRVGDSNQRDFFELVATNDANALLNAAHSEIREVVDLPLLQQWMLAVNEKLGRYQGIDMTDFHSSTRYENKLRITESIGTVRFERGTARSELTFINGKLARFHVTSDQLGDDWMGVPRDTSIYRQKAETFLVELATQQTDDALSHLSEALRQKLTHDKFRETVMLVQEKLGEFQDIVFLDEECEKSPDGLRLTFHFRLVGSKAPFDATAVFVIRGLKAHFDEFYVTPVDQASDDRL